MTNLPTIAMTPMPEFGYFDPVRQILDGKKCQTLRKCCHRWNKEITVNGKRTGIVIRFSKHVRLNRDQFLTDKFARADGFVATTVIGQIHTPSENLGWLLEQFYGEVPETMWCNHFRVVGRPANDQAAQDPTQAPTA